ncbi:MAG: hypothetical protein KJP25_01090 [Gammaproteobacteria bacterium]|nr:hypothetical protein [Gammaproteobacteria bacterium]MBT8152173.1 hypothetical protein [Gammaproteobacteria bacterium]NND39399.1 hypothetical protein [Pseudomonadales bacterium]NNM10610.1 hypothetical protein [Pseudomonadales bacterium]RZV54111.1 MAG: hypothetical protein EX270_07985 [Pseudomonadales bacterium]
MKTLTVISKKLAVLFAGLVICMLANATDVDEIPATIVAVDVPGNAVTLFDEGLGELKLQFAYDLRIQLMSGASGTIGNLRSGDGVTAVVDTGSQLVHAIYVVSEESAR